MNVFNREFGIHQGRIQKPGAPGTFVYELGHALLRDAAVTSGDYHEVTQTFRKTPGTRFIQASIAVRTPPALPVEANWVVSAWLNDALLVQRVLRPSKRVILLHDWYISLQDSLGAPADNVLKFRLELD